MQLTSAFALRHSFASEAGSKLEGISSQLVHVESDTGT